MNFHTIRKAAFHSDILFKFKQNLNLHEQEASRMIIPSSHLALQPASPWFSTLATGFLANSTDIEMYRYKDLLIDPKNDYNYPRNSFIQIKLPLEKNENLRSKYIRFKPGLIRVGRLMEALDFTAGFVSYFHAYSEPMSRSCTMVTVCVDHLRFFRPIRGDTDITINAYPSFVGKTTVEVRTDLLQRDNNGQESLAASALFLMAARNSEDYFKSIKVPKLTFEGEADLDKCLLREELGKINQDVRKKNGLQSFKQIPPSTEESQELHRIFVNMQEKKSITPFKLMRDTTKKKIILMHIQDRNLHGKIFGGYLMRESIELAWLVAYKFTRYDHPEFEAIDDFTFHNPVEIGSMVELEATVTYASGHYMNITVDATKIEFNEKEGISIKKKCTELHITFRCPNTTLKPSYPTTYDEAMKYLYSKRKIENETE